MAAPIADPLIREALPCRTRYAGKVFASLTLFIGLVSAALWTRVEDEQYSAGRDPATLMIDRPVQMQAARALDIAVPITEKSKNTLGELSIMDPFKTTEGRRLQEVGVPMTYEPEPAPAEIEEKEAGEKVSKGKLPPVKFKEMFFGREALFRRYRVVFDIDHERRSVPTTAMLVRELAKKHALGDTTRVVIKKIRKQFGRARTMGIALVYDSAHSLRCIERPNILKEMKLSDKEDWRFVGGVP